MANLSSSGLYQVSSELSHAVRLHGFCSVKLNSKKEALERLLEEAKQCRESLKAAPEELQECFLGPNGTGAYARLDELECPEATFMASRTLKLEVIKYCTTNRYKG